MFGGRSGRRVLGAEVSERGVQRHVRAEQRLRGVLDAPDARLVEVGAHEHRHRRQRHEHGAVGVLRVIGWPPITRADRALRQDQRLLLDVGVHVVDEEREVRAPDAVAVADAGFVLQARLGFELRDRLVRSTSRDASAVLPTKPLSPAMSGAATSKPEPVRPSVPRSVMCGARKPRLTDSKIVHGSVGREHAGDAERDVAGRQRIVRPQRLAVDERAVGRLCLVAGAAGPQRADQPHAIRADVVGRLREHAALRERRAVGHARTARRHGSGDRIDVERLRGEVLEVDVAAERQR